MNPSPLMTQSDKDIGWIETYSGKQFYLDGTDTDSIVIEDIAHALANLCRYNGHTNRFYSVAEHSVLVSYAVPKEYALWGLMHDASEAYLSDIPRPFKAMIANYKTMEANVMARIAKKYGMEPTEPAIVKNADSALLYPEAQHLMASRGELWADIDRYYDQFVIGIGYGEKSPAECLWDNLPQRGGVANMTKHYDGEITLTPPCWTPAQAKTAFLSRFIELKGY